VISRSSTILRIMGIEKEKRVLLNDTYFKRLQENSKAIAHASVGGIVGIYDPFNLDKYMEIKRNSKEIQKYQEKNQQGIQEFLERIADLSQEKMRLQKKIF